MENFKKLNTPIKILISLGILGVLIARMDMGDLGDIASHFYWHAWAWALLFTFGQMVILSLRWKMLVNLGKRHIDFKQAVQINLTSQLANLVFITSIGGLLVRIALSVQHGIGIFKTVVATIFDRLMTVAALVILSAAFLPGLAPYIDSRVFSNISGYLSIFILTGFIFAPVFVNVLVKKLPQRLRLKGRARYGIRYLHVLANNPLLLSKILLLSLIAQLSFFVSVFCLCAVGDVELTFTQLLTVLPVISLIAALPISIGGWGVREGAFVFGLGLLGIPMETAFIISIQVGLIGMLCMILAGIPSLLTSDLDISRIDNLKTILKKIRI